jgi:GST-like protein
MYDLHYWATPNGHKITIFLEELALPYRLVPVNIAKDEQFAPEFLKISPNNRIPAIVDHDPLDGGKPVSVFESGAILMYLAEKTGHFVPTDARGRWAMLEWLFWQVGGLGPMAGQQNHFRRASEQIPYAIERYTTETTRLYGVLDRRLADRPFLAGDDYSIADMAIYPWAAPFDMLNQSIESLPHVKRWLDAIAARPAVQKAYRIAAEVNPKANIPPGHRNAA